MARISLLFICLFFLLGVGIYFYLETDLSTAKEENMETNVSNTTEHEKIKSNQMNSAEKNSLFMHYIGQSSEDVVADFGPPIRQDRTPYGYTSYIYTDGLTYQIQFGVDKKNQVTMVYVVGDAEIDEPIQVGMEYEQIKRRYAFSDRVTLKTSDGLFNFELTEQDLQERPLIEVNDLFVQLYFDRFTKKVSSYRYLSKEALLVHRPYVLSYRGKLPNVQEPSKDEWIEIEAGSSQQVLELTNIIRNRHGLSPLKWEPDTAVVAYGHSKDMAENSYFSHVSPTEGELSQRLKKGGIVYSMAGENIAANYVDAIAAVEGWLNSEGHRVNMLSEEFTHLGIGVYQKHYTQNFITKW